MSSTEERIAERARNIAVVTRRSVIASVAGRWKDQYKHGATWGTCMGGSALTFYKKLNALDATVASREDVDAIIGNTSWTMIECNVCGDDVESAVTLCRHEYSESETVICRDCLTASLTTLANTPPAEAQLAETDSAATPQVSHDRSPE
jgi:hypothetical protein